MGAKCSVKLPQSNGVGQGFLAGAGCGNGVPGVGRGTETSRMKGKLFHLALAKLYHSELLPPP